MQSGITASAELHAAFNDFTADSTFFALPVTIAAERLQPLDLIPSSSSDFTKSLSSLTPHLQPKTPIFLILRKSSSPNDLAAVTYIPSTSPVRSKTLYASTRASLVRELGLEKFSESLFVTEALEVLDPKEWEDRARGKDASAADAGLLTREERELQGVKRAEEEERHGTMGRDLMGMGGSGGNGKAQVGATRGKSSSGIQMNITDEARDALGTMKVPNGASNGAFVQLGIDLPTETLILISSAASVDPSQISSKIPPDHPSYTFYRHPSTSSVVFIYTCPSSSKVKARMLYASTRASLVELAKSEGVVVAKRLEVGEPSEISEARLDEELAPKVEESTSRQGFARPKRPGRK